jgi:hypothetical protein
MATGDEKQIFGSWTALTCTLNALANNGSRLATAFANTDWPEIEIEVKIVNGTATAGYVSVWYYTGDGTTYETTGNASADAAYTLTGSEKPLGETINCTTNGGTFVKYFQLSSRRLYMPSNMGVIITNTTAAALGSGSTIRWRGIRKSSA